MTSRTFPGGLFVDAWPDGEQVVLYPNSHVDTHLGRIEFPPGEQHGPMFLDSTIVGGFKFVGLAHDNHAGMLEWRAAIGWVPGPVFRSGRGVFDRAGVWRDEAPAGFQFVTAAGVPVSRHVTYAPRHGLSEWIEVDGLVIGQGHDSLFPEGRGGMHLWDGLNHHQLDDGVCFFLKVKQIGHRVAVCWAKSGTGAVIWRGTLRELRAHPVSIYKPGVPVPPIVIPPEKEPDPMPVPNEEALVRATAEAHPELLARMQASSRATDALRKQLGEHHPDVRAGEHATDALKGEMCRVLVWPMHQKDPRWGLRRKDKSGAHAERSDGVKHATDAAMWKPDGKIVDVLSDYDVGWANRDGDFQPVDQWLQPLPPDGVVIVPPDKPPTPTGDWQAAMARADAHIAALAERVTVLEKRPGGGGGAGVTGKLVITGITLDVDGSP